MDAFLKSLRNRRAAIEALIEHEQARPAPDSLRLYGLKRLKLRFRERIEYLERMGREGQGTSIPLIRRRSVARAPARP